MSTSFTDRQTKCYQFVIDNTDELYQKIHEAKVAILKSEISKVDEGVAAMITDGLDDFTVELLTLL